MPRAQLKDRENVYEGASLEEMMKHIEAGKYDFPYFCENLVGITLHSGQLMAARSLVDYMKTNNRIAYIAVWVILAGNRSGKTVLLSCFHIWMNYYKHAGPGKEILPQYWEDVEYVTANLAPHSEQTLIIYEHILKICRGKFPIRHPDGHITTNYSLIRYFVDDPQLENPDKAPKNGPYRIRFANGSLFIAYTMGGNHGDTIQGRPYAFITYDEFGRSKDPYGEFRDIKPRLLDWNGMFVIITTPDEGNEDASDFLAEKLDLSEIKGSGFRFLNWSTEDNPHMTADAIDNLTNGLSKTEREQVLRGLIVRKTTKYFPGVKIEAMYDEKRCSYKPVDFINHMPEKGRFYAIGLDTSGMGRDQWSLYVYDVTELPFKKVFDFTSSADPNTNISETRRFVEDFYTMAGKENVDFTMDATAEGGTIVQSMLTDLSPFPYKFSIEKFTGRNGKHELLTSYRRMVQSEDIISHSDNGLRDQLRKYKGPKDDAGQKTDRIMASALACYRAYERISSPQENWILDIE